ncbi:MAG: phosphonoacetaldehyde hydrolase [Synergistaceae bacterium]|nr:phosphonoacetaldehyde hydrolase [Synergistaceae bacterium]
MNKENRRIRGVILDWAGTTVDYGCFAPLNVFAAIFSKHGIEISIDEAREPMGLPKIDHIREILKMKRISDTFEQRNGRGFTEDDVLRFYADFEPALMEILPDYCEPIDGIVEVVSSIRKSGLKIGSTTGYTAEMMDIVAPAALRSGYGPDALVTPDEVRFGRPYPYMIFKNMEKLGIFPPKCVIKVGDTVSDIKEGCNAGVWSIGVLSGSSETGISFDDSRRMSEKEISARKARAEERFRSAGADFVIDSFCELPELIEEINSRL